MIKIEVTTYDTGAKCIAMLDPVTDYPLKGVLVEPGNVVFLKGVDGGSSVGQCARCLLDEGLYTVDTDGTVTKVED